MTGLVWVDRFSVGVPLIDDQHKMLIQRVNDLAHAIERHQSVREIVRVLGFLTEYTNFHFATEEKHMKAHHYPGLNHHKAQHAEFKRTLAHLTEDFEEEGATRALADSINIFLTNWLATHFQDVDLEFGRFVRDKGLSLS